MKKLGIEEQIICMCLSKNTGFSIEQVQVIKNYLFKDYHYLNSIISERFYPSYEIAESWRRLSGKDGKNIQKHDVLLLHHELREIMILMTYPNATQSLAHNKANELYNYSDACEKYYAQFGY